MEALDLEVPALKARNAESPTPPLLKEDALRKIMAHTLSYSPYNKIGRCCKRTVNTNYGPMILSYSPNVRVYLRQ